MRLRTAVLLAAVSLPLAGVPAGLAAPPRLPKVCQLLVDPPDDTGLFGAPVSAPSLDITSADIATGAKYVTGVLRLKSLRPDPLTTDGSLYLLQFVLDKVVYEFKLQRSVEGGDRFTFSTPGAAEAGTPVGGRVDDGAGTITWTLDRKALPKISSGRFSGLVARGSIGRTGTSLDMGESTKVYTDRQPSCVASG